MDGTSRTKRLAMVLVASLLFPLVAVGGASAQVPGAPEVPGLPGGDDPGEPGSDDPAGTNTSCGSSTSVVADFDRNGTPDLVVGAPGDDLGQSEIDEEPVDPEAVVQSDNTGSVNVIYSRPASDDLPGLQPQHGPVGGPGPAFLHQDLPGAVGNATGNDRYGSALAAGDFNGDGIPDLAVGAPGKGNDAGAVFIYYGHPGGRGLQIGDPSSTSYNTVLHQNTRFMNGGAEAGDQFGFSLAAADFNDDGIADLAIGVPGEGIGAANNAGAVQIVYGSTGVGLTPEGAPIGTRPDKVLTQHETDNNHPEGIEAGDRFGHALAAGDFDGDGLTDLAVGSPREDVGQIPDAGAVHVIFSGGSGGLFMNRGPDKRTPEGFPGEYRFFHQNTGEVRGGAEPGDLFGCSLAAGDFDGDGDDDLAIGVPGESIGTVGGAGLVQVMYNGGVRKGVTATPPGAGRIDCPGTNCWTESQVWTENAGGIPGVSKFGDRFGATLHTANFDGGPDDLVIGVPDEQLYGFNRAGSIRLMQGFQNFGLTDTVNLTDPVPAFAQRPSNFILPAELTELGIAGDLDYTPVGLVVEEDDRFGASLAAADFDGDGNVDLVVGTPGESVGLIVNYLTEEVVGVPQDVDEFPEEFPLDGLHFDDAEDAGVIQILYADRSLSNPRHLLAAPPSPDVMYRDPGQPHTLVDDVTGAVGIVPESNGTGVIGGNINGYTNLLGNPGLPHPGGTAGDHFGSASS